VSRAEGYRTLSIVAKAAHLSKHLLIHHDLLIDGDKCLLHDLSEIAQHLVIVSRHNSINHLYGLLMDFLVNFVLIGKKLEVLFVLLCALPYHLSHDLSHIVTA
jgi:hypothetical protein